MSAWRVPHDRGVGRERDRPWRHPRCFRRLAADVVRTRPFLADVAPGSQNPWMLDPTARTARRTHGFTESVIREMTRVAAMHEALNLAQGFPDFPAPDALKAAACDAVRRDLNQYAVTWGSPRIRRALAEAYQYWYGMDVDPDRAITVTCGATEAMASALLAVVDPGDEVIVMEPFYENYGPDAILCGARPVWVPLERTRGSGGARESPTPW